MHHEIAVRVLHLLLFVLAVSGHTVTSDVNGILLVILMHNSFIQSDDGALPTNRLADHMN